MPLRDHFRLPVTRIASWEEIHGLWPGLMAMRLNEVLPPQYRSGAKIHLGSVVEVDVATFERLEDQQSQKNTNGVNANAWEALSPTVLLETEELAPAEYEVRVYDTTQFSQLVAVVELISPSNKDRPQRRSAFVDKCHALLQQDVCVMIVDPVTYLSSNLYSELASRMGAQPPAIADSSIYAVTCRTCRSSRGVRVEAWERELLVGSPLPALPLWIKEELAVTLDLEATYEDTCRGLRIP